jgi:hypothetical protein
MLVDTITPINETSQAVANQTLADYLAEKKIIADEQALKSAEVLAAKVALEEKNLKKIEDEKFKEAKLLKADQAEKYQATKETNKQAQEAKYAKMDAVTRADASHFHAAAVNSKAAQDKAIATIDQNTAALEDFLAAKTSVAEVNRRADNAAASDVVNSNVLDSKSETELAVEAYHDNMDAKATQQQTANATEAARLAAGGTLAIRKNILPHINVMD